jgi:predicted aminopeptidase
MPQTPRPKRSLWLLPLLIAGVLPLQGCYLLKQGSYILKYSLDAKPIDKLQKRPETPEDLRQFFARVQDIRRFAIDSVGLKANKNYSTYVAIDKKYLVDVVYAAGRDNFNQYKWCYPFFGCFPYKGFFERPDAEAEAARLQKKGYDIDIGRVDAFSTLGIFSDPLYSFMKRFSLFRLSSLIMHEQTHATLFIKNHIQFNEQLASFVGDEGALWYIRSRYGESSPQYLEALHEWKDSDAFTLLLQGLYRQLQPVYADSALSSAQKIERKQQIISHFKDSVAVNYDSIFQSQRYRGIPKAEINNAYIAVFMTYTLDLKDFYNLYNQENHDLAATLGKLKLLGKQKGDPAQNLRKLSQP